jgi:putative colanic acid biosynthesis UDP-glucose lipid carrier transferase
VLAIEVQRNSLTAFEQALKRTLDIAGALTGLVLLSPLMLIVAVAIKLDSSGPLLFRQARIGFSGRPFRIYKFRTMTVAEDGEVIPQATRNDARVTRLGRLLRRSSIDELPQLFNVLKGEMSLVGPRPHALAHDNQYTRLIANYSFRHHMKPGITGWAQVCGFRGETPTVDLMERRLEHDLWYINNWTIWLDIKTVLLTVVLLMTQDDAY